MKGEKSVMCCIINSKPSSNCIRHTKNRAKRISIIFRQNKSSSSEVSWICYLYFWIFEVIATNQGSNVCCAIFNSIYELFHIQSLKITDYRPESNGVLRRCDKTLIKHMRFLLKIKNWTTCTNGSPMDVFLII